MLNAKRLSLALLWPSVWATVSLAAGGEDLATFVEVQQQAGSHIGCRRNGVEHILASNLDPRRPQGRSNADLEVSTNRHGASTSATLRSRLQESRVTIKGLAGASAAWRDPPPGADRIGGGAAVMFLARWETGPVPVVFRCDGSIGATLVDKHRPAPKPASIHVKLTTGSGVVLWQQRSDGTDGDTLKAASFRETLAPHQEYRFAVYAQAEALCDRDQEALQSLAAWFDLETELVAAGAQEPPSSPGKLVVVSPEIKLLQLDGRAIDPAHLKERQGFREYSLPAGVHALTASFHRIAPATVESVQDIQGRPARVSHFIRAGHTYVVLYHALADQEREFAGWLQRVTRALTTPPDAYWSLEIVDLADLRSQIAPPRPPAASPAEAKDRPATTEPNATAATVPAPDPARPGLTPEIVDALRRYLALDAAPPVPEEAGKRAEPSTSPALQ